MLKPWANYPDPGPWYKNCTTVGCLESDIAIDEERGIILAGTFNRPTWSQARNAVGACSVCGQTPEDAAPIEPGDPPYQRNATINAWNIDTGEIMWMYQIGDNEDGFGFRGGTITSGGLVWFAAPDGVQRALDVETGEVLYELNLGSATSIQPTIAADADGNMKLFRVIGWSGHHGTNAPGAIMAYGLPDNLQAQIQAQQLLEDRAAAAAAAEARAGELERRAADAEARAADLEARGPEIVEVPVEILVEVPVEVEVQTTRPISYVAIGLGVVLVVISGVLFTRRRTT